MTKEDLQQLCDLREEIAEIEMKIAKLSSRGSRIVSDKVQASMKDFPYTPTSVKITGFDVVADKNTRAQIMNAIGEKEEPGSRTGNQNHSIHQLHTTEQDPENGGIQIHRWIHLGEDRADLPL